MGHLRHAPESNCLGAPLLTARPSLVHTALDTATHSLLSGTIKKNYNKRKRTQRRIRRNDRRTKERERRNDRKRARTMTTQVRFFLLLLLLGNRQRDGGDGQAKAEGESPGGHGEKHVQQKDAEKAGDRSEPTYFKNTHHP